MSSSRPYPLTELVGLECRGPSRCFEWLMIQIGPLRVSRSRLGRVRTVGEWALHVECPVFVSCRHLIDPTIDDLLARQPPRSIEHIELDESGRLHIALSGDAVIDIVPDEDDEEEAWRIFRPDDRPLRHWVWRDRCLRLRERERRDPPSV